jgi:GNAT superfamily N-acetyltransferase
MERRRGDYVLTDDPSRMDAATIHSWLYGQAYWSLGRSLEDVTASLSQSRTYGVLHGEEQVAVGRVISDGVTFAYLCDFFVAEARRNQAIGSWMLACMIEDLRTSKVAQILLATRDAHALYLRAGFHSLTRPERWLELDPTAETTT